MSTVWHDMVRPKKLDTDLKTLSDSYTRFEAEPFERGFGVTLGNSLRRLLFSSISGAAVVGVKFEGIHHEFSTIDGVVEDVSEMILNIKQLIISQETDAPATLILTASGEGVVSAGEIETPAGVTILNKELALATITDPNVSIMVEMFTTTGRGYSPADNNVDPGWDISVIPVDAIFSPVLNVAFSVEQTRVEQSSDFDKLILDVTTDGSIKPVDAVAQAAKSLKDHTQIFINFEEEEEPVTKRVNEEKLRVAKNLRKSVEELELSVRSYNCLKNAEIKSIFELVTKTDGEMLKTRNFGRKSLNEIKEILTEMGLHLGMNVEDYREELTMIEQGLANGS